MPSRSLYVITGGLAGAGVEYLAIAMPHRGRRPFQPQGHSRPGEFEQTLPGSSESDGADDAACRVELQRMRRGVRADAVGFDRPASSNRGVYSSLGTGGLAYSTVACWPVRLWNCY
ncbi:hypothetical protein [Streptomyces sp. NPDC006463]|uniref:hypothetical protein n=1 Tax=Streptomyces sp. NPDC006463 TaxID=3364746 RepID=UPI0036908AA2